ncbi:MAG: glycerophosphodiester phosphodiesterase [Planctomycetota bacterium]
MIDRVAVTAHRGSSHSAPENSLSAVRMAIEQGADYAEIDVQETADGVLVVLHDEDLMRVTGTAAKIWEIDYGDLARLDAGSWFSEEFRGERIPKLEEVVELAGNRIKLNIELKFNGHDQKLAQRVAETVGRRQFQQKCVVSSLDYDGLMEARRSDPRLKIGLVAARPIGDIAALDVDFLSVNTDIATAELIDRARAAGKQVHVWTVNDPEQMSALVDLGAENIITDDPPAMIARLRQRA